MNKRNGVGQRGEGQRRRIRKWGWKKPVTVRMMKKRRRLSHGRHRRKRERRLFIKYIPSINLHDFHRASASRTVHLSNRTVHFIEPNRIAISRSQNKPYRTVQGLCSARARYCRARAEPNRRKNVRYGTVR